MDLRSRLKKLERTLTEPNATAQPEEACICFPPGEPPAFHWMAEVETAAAVCCPLHGVRFHAIDTPVVFQAKWARPSDSATVDWPNHSPQYSKAWRASFPPNLWPADERWQFQPEITVALILRDGTELPSGGCADEWQTQKLEAGR
jgi:hypothetical protein